MMTRCTCVITWYDVTEILSFRQRRNGRVLILMQIPVIIYSYDTSSNVGNRGWDVSKAPAEPLPLAQSLRRAHEIMDDGCGCYELFIILFF